MTNKDLLKKPKKDIKDDIPKIKNNIFKEGIINQCDLLYLPNSQFGFKYALVSVDVYNSILDAVALKDKTANSIINGLKEIYEKHKILKKPLILQMDSGKEFKNNNVLSFLEETNIRPKFTLINRHRQNSIVENANYRLGKIILENQALKELETGKKTTSWHNLLSNYVKTLNEKIKPNKNIYDPYKDIKSNNAIVEMIDIDTPVRKILDYPVNAFDKKRVDSKFRVGDIRWSPDIYNVKRVIFNPNMPLLYMLNKKDEPEKIDTSVAYTRNQLQLI